jgi:glutathione synthase/RimK-type ligase-like ATP-grasp enzyme
MIPIYILTDYKSRFETKYTSIPYRSGQNKDLLKKAFEGKGIQVNFINFPEISFRDNLKNKYFLYCGSEDQSGFYKSYIEDVVFGLEKAGAIVIPSFIYLKAHHNKIFMEILRDLSLEEEIKNIKSLYFGSFEEIKNYKKNILWPVVFKPAYGSMSKGVGLAKNMFELKKLIKKSSRTYNFLGEIKDIIRKKIYTGYIPDSKYRKKFIIQTFIPNISGDWKILIYGNKYFILKRKNRNNDFRASGGGLLSYERQIPNGLLDFAEKVFKTFSVPNISLDIGYNGKEFYLFEFQFIYFGTYTIEHSDFYFIKRNNVWTLIEKKSVLEEVFAESIANYIDIHCRNL